jgi:hypothetical protein
MQHQGTAADATDEVGLSPEIYAIHRSWWRERDGAQADRMLDAHVTTLKGSNPVGQLRDIVFSLKAEHESGRVKAPGKVIEHRIKRANARAAADAASKAGQFNPHQELGRVGFGDKVTGADANDILEAVPGSDPQQVRRRIREVCGKWAGANGKTRSRQDVVGEVIRRLRSGCASELPATTSKDPIRITEPTIGAKDQAAGFAALREQMRGRTAASHPTSAVKPSQE